MWGMHGRGCARQEVCIAGACVAGVGMCGSGVCVWRGGEGEGHAWQEQVVRILLECRAFISTRPFTHKHVKMSVGKWIMETTRPHKHVQIARNQNLFCLTSLSTIISQ